MKLVFVTWVSILCGVRYVFGLSSALRQPTSTWRRVTTSNSHAQDESIAKRRVVSIDSEGQSQDFEPGVNLQKVVVGVDRQGTTVQLRSQQAFGPTDPSCVQPEGTSLSLGYIRGALQVLSKQLIFSVQYMKPNNEKIDKYYDGRTPCLTFTQMREDVSAIYQLMLERGVHQSQVNKITTSVKYFSVRLSADSCGYYGVGRSVTCTSIQRGTDGSKPSSWGSHIAGKFAHECFHGWEWMTFNGKANNGDESEWTQFFFVFSSYANKVYHMRKAGQVPNYLPYTDYGLINENEWGSECFRNLLYPDDAIEPSTNWRFIQEYLPKYTKYWNCLWKEDKSHSDCVAESGVTTGMSPPQTDPKSSPPPRYETEGVVFEIEDQAAIWDVCFSSRLGTAASWENVQRFNKIVRTQAEGLPGNAASYYQLGFGDCNHDGVVDWTCWYNGPGPPGVGNGQYQWNEDNTCDRCGTWSFIVSGKVGDTWIYYRPDRVDDSPQQLKTLVQPWAHQWQGDHGSCNGAALFERNPSWFTTWYPPTGISGSNAGAAIGVVNKGSDGGSACPVLDVNANCEQYGAAGDCTSNQWKSWMDSNCKCTCQKLEYTSSAEPASGGSSSGGTGCVDVQTLAFCKSYVDIGACTSQAAWMQQYCCKSCQDSLASSPPASSSPVIATCVNIIDDDSCAAAANLGSCEISKVWMTTNCCKTCKGFTLGSISKTAATTTTTTTTTTTVATCVDVQSEATCKTYADAGNCDMNKEWMNQNCCKTCEDLTSGTTVNKGVASTSCVDALSEATCKDNANLGYCETYKSYMEQNCCKTCENILSGSTGAGKPANSGTSSAATSCIDTKTDCLVWAALGECTKAKEYMDQNCCKSCTDLASGASAKAASGGSIPGCVSNVCSSNGNRQTWNAGFGSCASYAQSGGNNYAHCSQDKMNGVAADCVCSECGKCS